MDEAAWDKHRSAALAILGRDHYARLLKTAAIARQAGRLRYWHEELMAGVATAVGRPFAGLADFLAAFDGAPDPPADPTAPEPHPADPPPAGPPPDPSHGPDEHLHFPDCCLQTNQFTLSVRADVERTAGALAELIGPMAEWVRSAAGREVTLRARAYLVYRLAGHVWSTVLAWHDDWDQEGEARKLSKALRCKVIAFGGSDVSDGYGYTLYRTGRKIEWWATGNDVNNAERTKLAEAAGETWTPTMTDGFGSSFREETVGGRHLEPVELPKHLLQRPGGLRSRVAVRRLLWHPRLAVVGRDAAGGAAGRGGGLRADRLGGWSGRGGVRPACPGTSTHPA